MKVFNKNNITFKAKPQQLVKADKVLRLMNAHCPAVSNTRYYKFNTTKKSSYMQQNVAMLGMQFVLMRRNLHRSETNDTPQNYCQYLLKTIKKFRLANCGELVRLFSFISCLNGLKAKRASLLPSSIDHCVALIPLKEDSFKKTDFTKTPISKMKDFLIADPWLGIVDYAPNIATLYKNHPDYKRFIGDSNVDNYDELIHKIKLDNFYLHPKEEISTSLSNEEIDFFRKTTPELFINPKELIKH